MKPIKKIAGKTIKMGDALPMIDSMVGREQVSWSELLVLKTEVAMLAAVVASVDAEMDLC